MTPFRVRRRLLDRRARTPKAKVTDRELRRWAKAAIAAARPDRLERLERRVDHLDKTLLALASILETSVEQGRELRDERADGSDIACPCCGVRFDSDDLLDHIENPPPNCNRVQWISGAHGRMADRLQGRDNR